IPPRLGTAVTRRATSSSGGLSCKCSAVFQARYAPGLELSGVQYCSPRKAGQEVRTRPLAASCLCCLGESDHRPFFTVFTSLCNIQAVSSSEVLAIHPP